MRIAGFFRLDSNLSVMDATALALVDPAVIGVAGVRSLVYYGAIYGITIAVAFWIYRDARSRGSRYAPIWAVATLVFTIVAVLPYLYLRWRAGPVTAADRV